MIAADLRRVRRGARAIARLALDDLLHAAFLHAMRPLAGRPMVPGWEDEAAATMQAQLDALADAGAFRFFGIRGARDLGRLEIQFWIRSTRGHFSLVSEPVAAAIMAGGRRGAGWRDPFELTDADLAR